MKCHNLSVCREEGYTHVCVSENVHIHTCAQVMG